MSTVIHDLAVIISASASLIAALAALASILVSLRNGRKIEVVRSESNSMKDELVRTTAEKSFAEGVKAGEKNGKG